MKAEKPLKILTLDGGGLQAISTLVILNKLLDTIAHHNGVSHKKPRPCEVFDTIAGIGAGGWLAILLGRFHMDIATCLSEWNRITHCITPRSKSEEIRMRAFQHCYFNPERLVEQIDSLTQEYCTGEHLFDRERGTIRTRHVFVAALRSDAQDYSLFRTYRIPKTAKLPEKMREGPEKPETFKISSAFGVTGSAKYFSPPWKERMARSGKTTFNDNKYPKPHNITELALDEMWGIYGTDVPLSVIVNIGPGLPDKCDVYQIARRFSWGLSPPDTPTISKHTKIPLQQLGNAINKRVSVTKGNDMSLPNNERPTIKFRRDEVQGSGPTSDLKKQAVARSNTFGSVYNRGVKEKLRRAESDIERDIKRKLENVRPGNSALYYRLAPDQAPQGTAQNDSSSPGVTLAAADNYLSQPSVERSIDDIERRLSDSGVSGISAC
ncbi:hypothetical protein LSUE1_G005975 [Lachnellula suecica]|uniref:PNPLA domain-containing protein n=1 Tax=Lachnellula suecica TaxID=602035 RepID=A0A8T9C9U8_9HELO|nr:hypothetical protein LSUE1_G005975 [Lachnellula suecica]